ncbi:hypothetical protein C8J57DRAFT_685288 [Mycena rebaudengoi]|nr:hypothetical protein C8J57DRAFT_685288 [Mycena rebaudengoi]
MAKRRIKVKGRNKPRLYISLLYRQNKDNFHWAITLAPKAEIPGTKDSMRYDAANTIHASWDGVLPWRYRCDLVDPLLDMKLVTRVLVAKIASNRSFDAWCALIDQTCRAVPLIQNNPAWTCRIWAHNALGALHALNGDFSTIPDVLAGNMEEGEIVAFAQIAKARLLGGNLPLGDIYAIPLLDMRRQ